MIAADITGLLKRAHPAQAGRRRDLCPPREFDIGNPAIGLQFGKNSHINGIKFVVFHGET